MSDTLPLYPLKFAPLYCARMWGGTMMTEFLHRDVPVSETPIGEAWEIVDRPEAASSVVNGALTGWTLRRLMETCGPAITGKPVPDNRFPLIVKLIDAAQRLSLQVHPDAATATALGNGAEAKTEMWYLLAHRPGARIFAGLSRRATRQRMRELLNTTELEQLLQSHDSHVRDTYFLPGGTLHAIGGGNLLLEVQQNSDTTFRISDWNRVGPDGKPRQLHIEQGLQAIQFVNRSSPRIAAASDEPAHSRRLPLITHCPYFRVDELRLQAVWHDDTAATGSFHLLTAINEPLRISSCGVETTAGPGETILVPFVCGKYEIKSAGAYPALVVRVTL